MFWFGALYWLDFACGLFLVLDALFVELVLLICLWLMRLVCCLLVDLGLLVCIGFGLVFDLIVWAVDFGCLR